MLPTGNESIQHKYLDINPEGTLLQESQDIAEELKIMKRIYNEQQKVVKDFKRHLAHPLGKRKKAVGDAVLIRKLIDALKNQDNEQEDEETGGKSEKEPLPHEESVHEAQVLLELIESRQAEIQDLEESALRTCQQVGQRL